MDIDIRKTAIIAGDVCVSYNDMLLQCARYAAMMPKTEKERVVLFSENRRGWIYAFFAVWKTGNIAVPIDACSTPHDVAYILSDCKPQCVWASSHTLATVEEGVRLSGLTTKILLVDDQENEPAEGLYTGDLPWASLSKENNSDTALIIYTSGTTGMPKGVMLSYENLWINIKSVSMDVPIYNSERRVMILLPLHHILPLLGSLVAPICLGAGVAICQSLSGSDLMQTLVKGQVGIVIGVPRLYQSLYAGIKKKIDSNVVTRTLFRICEMVGSRQLSRTVFASLRKKMGGKISYFVSGGAALDVEIGNGLATLGLDVLEGYGMTEAAPMIAFTRPDDIKPGCSGLPLPCVETKIVDGELLVRGRNIMKGYFGRPQETAEVLDKDGYLHTGDLAAIDEKGRVYITGRCKEIIVLSNGKNVQPNEIEYKLEKFDHYVKEAAVAQDADLLRAIIVPQPEWASTLTDQDVEAALKREVLEPYNQTVPNYKKLMSLMVYRHDLPRTKMEKLQRFKLKDILADRISLAEEQKEKEEEPDSREYRMIKHFIEDEKKVKVLPSSHLETDLAMDSLDKIGLQGFLERSFGVTVKSEQMATFANVRALAEYVCLKKTRIEEEELDWSQLLLSDSSSLVLPHPSFLYLAGEKCFKLFFRLWNNLTILGTQNIPSHGPYILAPNHQSYVDGPIAISALSCKAMRDIYTYATEEHVRGKFRRYLAGNNNIIIMERANLRDSILKMAEVLKRDKCILIFPEGSRTHDGEIETFKRTFAILSMEMDIPVVPVCIRGAYQALSRYDKFLKPYHIEVEYLPPMKAKEGEDYDSFAESVRRSLENAQYN